MTITSQLRRAAGSLLSVLGPGQKKRAHDSLDDEGEEGAEEAKVQEQDGDQGEGDDGEDEEKDDVRVAGDDTETNHPSGAGLDPRCLEQWDKYMMPIDLGEIEAELEAAASSGRLTSRVSMETCRFVISIFRNDGPGAKGGWGSFVWYASKMDRNIRFLNKTWPTWRTRLYLDDSVPGPYVDYLRTELNVEVINVQHLRKGLYRDYLLPSVRPLVIDDPTVSRFVSFDCHDELTDSTVTDWVNNSQFNNPRAQTRALFTYWWVEMGPDNPPGAHCHINHIDYDATTRAHPPPQDGREGLQDFMHRHVDAGAWGMIGGQGLFRASTAHLQHYMTDRLVDFAKDTRIRPGHEEVLMDLTLGKLMRCRRRFVGLRPAFTGCTDKVEASEAEVKEWKARFCPRKEDDINWATGPRASDLVIGGPSRGDCVVVDGEVDLTALGLPRKECALTKAYMEQCWGDNLREKVIERAKAAKGQTSEQSQATSASQHKSTKRARRK